MGVDGPRLLSRAGVAVASVAGTLIVRGNKGHAVVRTRIHGTRNVSFARPGAGRLATVPIAGGFTVKVELCHINWSCVVAGVIAAIVASIVTGGAGTVLVGAFCEGLADSIIAAVVAAVDASKFQQCPAS